MRDESDVAARHAFRQSKTGELVDIKEAPQLSAGLNASRARIKALKLRLQLETVPLEFVVNEDNGKPYDESTYRHWVSTARAVAVFGFLARDTVRQAIVRAERLTTELIRTIDRLFAPFPLDEENKAQRARAVDQRARMLAEWLDALAARDSNGNGAARRLKPCSSLMFVNGAGELDQKHDQDLRDTCVMLWPPPVSTHSASPDGSRAGAAGCICPRRVARIAVRNSARCARRLTAAFGTAKSACWLGWAFLLDRSPLTLQMPSASAPRTAGNRVLNRVVFSCPFWTAECRSHVCHGPTETPLVICHLS
jgi:hypothetical protein